MNIYEINEFNIKEKKIKKDFIECTFFKKLQEYLQKTGNFFIFNEWRKIYNSINNELCSFNIRIYYPSDIIAFYKYADGYGFCLYIDKDENDSDYSNQYKFKVEISISDEFIHLLTKYNEKDFKKWIESKRISAINSINENIKELKELEKQINNTIII